MAIRNQTEHAWRVYEQATPIYIGDDQFGLHQYKANLVEVGVVSAMTSAEAFEAGRAFVKLPVLELING